MSRETSPKETGSRETDHHPENLHLRVEEDYDTLSKAGANLVAGLFKEKPDAAVIVATGNTPMGLYRELATTYASGAFDSQKLRVFQLDAYLGLTPDDPRSLNRWTKNAFLTPLSIDARQVVGLPGDSPDPQATCRAYDEAVAQVGGFDLAILGLGPNGHLGFNEPPSRDTDKTRIVSLTEESIASNAKYWGGRDQVPQQALTAGMNVLLAAKKILLLVSGVHKRDVLRKTLVEPITHEVPASYLRNSGDVTVLVDRAASGSLALK